jgi:hypothetical protein
VRARREPLQDEFCPGHPRRIAGLDFVAQSGEPLEPGRRFGCRDVNNAPSLGRERKRFHARIFVPLCASFVPWRFWKRLVIFSGMVLTHWQKTRIFVTVENGSSEMEKPAKGGPSH